MCNVQEVAQSVICYWRKDELRKELKGLKKKVDDMDKARKAAVLNLSLIHISEPTRR